MHLTSLPGPYGIGEIGRHARAFIDRLLDMNLTVWQFLPTGPTAYGDSPYQPLSTFAGNEMLIDIGDLVDNGFLTEEEVSELTTLPEQFVDYGALIPVKNRLLRTAATRFRESASPFLKEAYGTFVTEHDEKWLHDYALFRILPPARGDPCAGKVRGARDRADQDHAVSVPLPVAGTAGPCSQEWGEPFR
jgi:4-alpha-glucanotransferase